MTTRTAGWLVVALTLAGAVLRLPGLNSGLWFDEIVTLVESVRPALAEIVTAFPGNNNHPLYSLLAHLSVSAFGEHPWTLRFPAFLFGVASIPLLYGLAITVTTRTEAVAATLLMAVAYHAIWFSQNARAYTMLLAFTLLATWLLLRLLNRADLRLAMLYGAVMGLGIYAHLTMAFVAVAHVLLWGWVMWRADATTRRTAVRAAVIAFGTAGVVGAAAYLPMAAQVLKFFSGPPQETAAVATSKWAVFEVLRGLRIGFGTVGVAAALALLAVGGLSYLKRSPLILGFFILPGFITAATMVAMGAPIRPRFFFSLLGFGLLILVRGAVATGGALAQWTGKTDWRSERIGVMVVGVIAAASIWSLGYNYRYPKQDFEGALRFVEAHRRPSDAVVTAGLAIYPFERYYREPWTAVERAEDLERVSRESPRLWAIYSFPVYMDQGLVAALERGCRVEGVFVGTLGGGDVIVCSMTAAPAS